MNEIEKLYENAKIFCLHPSGFCKHIGATCERCKRHKYPPFTAEKQIELIKWLSKFNLRIEQSAYTEKYYFIELLMGAYSKFMPNFEQALAGIINYLWQDLTEEEKEQIRSVLR